MNFYDLKKVVKNIDRLLSEEEKQKEIFVDLDDISTEYFLNGCNPLLENIACTTEGIFIEVKELPEE